MWIMPNKRGGSASYAQQTINTDTVTGKFGLIASGDGRDGSISMQQDTDLYLAKLVKGQSANFTLRDGRGAYAQMARGKATLDNQPLVAGDGAHWEGTSEDGGPVTFTAQEDSEILLYDLN